MTKRNLQCEKLLHELQSYLYCLILALDFLISNFFFDLFDLFFSSFFLFSLKSLYISSILFLSSSLSTTCGHLLKSHGFSVSGCTAFCDSIVLVLIHSGIESSDSSYAIGIALHLLAATKEVNQGHFTLQIHVGVSMSIMLLFLEGLGLD